MARVFQKYVIPDSEPILNKPTEIIKEKEPERDITKTLRHSHNALRMSDLIQESPRKEKIQAQEIEEEKDPDAALMVPMYWLMKGLRGMMQIAGNK